MSEFLKRYYYILTAYIPRKLPTTDEEYFEMLNVLSLYYDVPISEECWITIAGQVTNCPGHKLRKPWGHIANCAKRLSVNKVAQARKMKAINGLKAQLEMATQLEAARIKHEMESTDKQEFTISPELSEKAEIIEEHSPTES